MQLSTDPNVAFDVLDVLGGFCSLTRRSPTLDGSVPLRVAQACLPLLEGNAFGYQVMVHERLELSRRLGRYVLSEAPEPLARRVRAVLPMLGSRGLFTPQGSWARSFAQGLFAPRGPWLFTGLFVRPRAGVRLRLSSVKNRRSLAYDVREALIDRTDAWTPLVLELEPRAGTCIMHGEVATLAALPAQVGFRTLTLAEADEVAAAHLSFYDRSYFERKRAGEIPRSYRRGSRREILGEEEVPIVDVVEAGINTVTLGTPRSFHRPEGPVAATDAAADRLVFHNAVSFSVQFDGMHVQVEPDASELSRFAERVHTCWGARLGPEAHRGALLYLSKYVTPHPTGEPHFFVKPSVLFRTAKGTSLLLEGRSFEAAEVMRGVIESDWFHAAPAVFQLTRPGSWSVRAGTPLLELFPQPRALADAGFASHDAGLSP